MRETFRPKVELRQHTLRTIKVTRGGGFCLHSRRQPIGPKGGRTTKAGTEEGEGKKGVQSDQGGEEESRSPKIPETGPKKKGAGLNTR